MWHSDVNPLPENITYHILLWLPVISLLRFKSVCKSWYALIDSSYFIKYHLRHHHYDCPVLKNRNQTLIFPIPSNDPPITTFLLTSVDNFEVPTVKLELEAPVLSEINYTQVARMSTFDGIICMSVREGNFYDGTTYIVYLFNPATKQVRVLPRSSLLITPPRPGEYMSVFIGFGIDVITNDYKVVRIFTYNGIWNEPRIENQVEVYNLSTNSWRTIKAVLPVEFGIRYHVHPIRPFRNGTCYCWWGRIYSPDPDQDKNLIFCFDFGSEEFRTINFPDGNGYKKRKLDIINDAIACISYDDCTNLDIWVLNEYGSGDNEYSWTLRNRFLDFCQMKSLYLTPCYFWLSLDGIYVFFVEKDQLWRYDLTTHAIKKCPLLEFIGIIKDHPFVNDDDSIASLLINGLKHAAVFKESLVSLGGGNGLPSHLGKTLREGSSVEPFEYCGYKYSHRRREENGMQKLFNSEERK